MQNNKVLKSIRYMLKLRDKTIAKICIVGGLDVDVLQIGNFLRKDKEPGFERCPNKILHCFLNGLIATYRGPRPEGEFPPYVRITKTNANNIILKKLKVAFSLKTQDIKTIFDLSGLKVSEAEVSAILRKEGKPLYRECGDKYLRYFLKGLIVYKRGPEEQNKKTKSKKIAEDSTEAKTEKKVVKRTTKKASDTDEKPVKRTRTTKA